MIPEQAPELGPKRSALSLALPGGSELRSALFKLADEVSRVCLEGSGNDGEVRAHAR
jgi:hypothetical protein